LVSGPSEVNSRRIVDLHQQEAAQSFFFLAITLVDPGYRALEQQRTWDSEQVGARLPVAYNEGQI
jgi:hypothetical protein